MVLEGFGSFSESGKYKWRIAVHLDISNKFLFVCVSFEGAWLSYTAAFPRWKESQWTQWDERPWIAA